MLLTVCVCASRTSLEVCSTDVDVDSVASLISHILAVLSSEQEANSVHDALHFILLISSLCPLNRLCERLIVEENLTWLT
jgi:hypothetical protein